MLKKALIFLILFSIAAAVVVLQALGKVGLVEVRSQLQAAGFWAPLLYILIYTIATALILPSTVLNLTGGALFGTLWGLLWTTLAALLSAIVTFWVTRLWAQSWVQQRLDQRWHNFDQEIREGGMFYLLAIRLLPIIPYGIANYSAGLTSVRFQDYVVGTTLGTVPGLLPFVMLGDSGVVAMHTGQLWHIVLPLTLIGLLVLFATWYQRHRPGRQ